MGHSLLLLFRRLEDLEGAQQGLVHAHHGARIVEFAAVVGGGEQRDQLTLGEELVSVFNHLMRTADQVHVVFLQEARHNVRAECEGHTPVVLAPACDVFVGVGPEQIAEQAAIRDLVRC